jgi:hypothetical protein
MDPVLGVFTSPDPILNTEDQRGFTPYTYAFGNVINTSDPSGLKPTCDCEDDWGPHYGTVPGSAAELQADYERNRRVADPATPITQPTAAAAPGNSSRWTTNGAGRIVAKGTDWTDPSTQLAEAQMQSSLLQFIEDALNSNPDTTMAAGIVGPFKLANGARKAAAEAAAITKEAAAVAKVVDVAATRVKLRVETKAKIQDVAPKTTTGDFIDPNTGQVIPQPGPFHYGHKPGFEWWRTQQLARQQGWTRQQVLEYENDWTHYQIEDPRSNMSHLYEMPR